ncbi:LysE family transporter [bacterium]|nr:LysE family transporter [bacterium]
MAALTGFFLGLALVIGIGPQNLLVIRRGLVSASLGMTAAGTAAVTDLVVITSGIFFFSPNLSSGGSQWLSFGAGCYLLYCAWDAARDTPLEGAGEGTSPSHMLHRATARAAFLYSFLNPWAWCDAVMVIGQQAQSFQAGDRVLFAAGASFASLFWFSLVATSVSIFGSRVLTPSVQRALQRGSALLLVALALSCFSGAIFS